MEDISVYEYAFLAAALAPLFFIFFDYHKSKNIWKAFLFVALILSGIILVFMLWDYLGMFVLYTLPLFAAFPFIIAVVGKKRKN
ncbi:MAG: hypothetical protein ACI9J3_002382 [Parvicellaceae bacterium]|jgi:hypothetical protein